MENVVSLCSVFTPKRQLTRPENCNSPVIGILLRTVQYIARKMLLLFFPPFHMLLSPFFTMSETILKVTIAVIVS